MNISLKTIFVIGLRIFGILKYSAIFFWNVSIPNKYEIENLALSYEINKSVDYRLKPYLLPISSLIKFPYKKVTASKKVVKLCLRYRQE